MIFLVELAQVESEITFESFKERVEVEEIDKKTNERTKKVVLRENLEYKYFILAYL